MSERLSDLRRQRALIAEHLSWLDREIAAAGGEALPSPAVPLPPPPEPISGTDLLAADRILSEFRDEAERSPARVRLGCIGIFAAGMALLILGVATIYWLRYR